MSWWSDLVQAVAEGAAGVPAPANTPAVSAATSAPGIGLVTTIQGIYAGATDGKFWRSLGWLLLGVVLMLMGVGWWIGPSSARMSPGGLAAGAARRLA